MRKPDPFDLESRKNAIPPSATDDEKRLHIIGQFMAVELVLRLLVEHTGCANDLTRAMAVIKVSEEHAADPSSRVLLKDCHQMMIKMTLAYPFLRDTTE